MLDMRIWIRCERVECMEVSSVVDGMIIVQEKLWIVSDYIFFDNTHVRCITSLSSRYFNPL